MTWIKYRYLLAILAVFLLWFFWLKHHDNVSPLIPHVNTAKVRVGDLAFNINLPGQVESLRDIQVRSRINGFIRNIYYPNGSIVPQGAIIYTIDDDELQTQKRQIIAQIKQIQHALNFAESELSRSQILRNKDFVSQSQLENQIAETEKLRAQILEQQARLENIDFQLAYTTIKAPFSGKIGFHKYELGSLVEAQKEMLSLQQYDPIGIAFYLSEKYLDSLKKGQEIFLKTLDGKKLLQQAIITTIDNSIDSKKGSIRVRAELKNNDLVPGQYINVILQLNAYKNVNIVPKSALQTGQSGDFVFVLENNIAKIRLVKVILETDKEIALQNVKPGEVVVTSGHFKLTDGAKAKSV